MKHMEGMQGVFAVCTCACACSWRVWEREGEYSLLLGRMISPVLYKASSNLDYISYADRLCFPGRRSPSQSLRGSGKSEERGAEPVQAGAGMPRILMRPRATSTSQEVWLVCLPSCQPHKVLPNVNISSRWPPTPSLWFVSFCLGVGVARGNH